KAPKPKYIQKKANSDTSPKKKPIKATKGTRLKSKAKVAKPDKKKQPAKKTTTKGLVVLSEVTLTEAEQLKLATKRSKKDFRMSHVSGSGDGVDIQSKIPDEQQQKTFGTDEGTGTIPGVPDVPTYESKSKKESWGDSEDEDDNDDDGDNNDDDSDSDDHDDDSDDERTKSDRDEIPDPNLTNQTEHEEEDVNDRVHTPSDYEFTDDENLDDEETMDDEEDDKVTKELYDDVNVNLGNEDTDMTNVDQGALEQQNKTRDPTQSSYVSFDFTIKLLNLKNPSPADNEIASLMETLARHAMVIPENISVDRYIDNKLGEAINKAILAHNLDCRQEAQDENNAYIELVDTSMRALIKEGVNTQLP
ncbi:hypothetical protein Tco_0578556, partial [Tanacetum coccineum]